MTRVAVIGNAGGGKSTMCRKLSARTGLPYFAVDDILWKPGWVRSSEDEFDRAHEVLVGADRWIIDGFGTWNSVMRRFQACDTIVLVDFPLWRHYWWAAKRQIAAAFGGRPDGPEGCPMLPVTFRLFRMMWWLHRSMRPKLLAAIAMHEKDKAVVYIGSPQQLTAFSDDPESFVTSP